jgi:hypothetical protein
MHERRLRTTGKKNTVGSACCNLPTITQYDATQHARENGWEGKLSRGLELVQCGRKMQSLRSQRRGERGVETVSQTFFQDVITLKGSTS